MGKECRRYVQQALSLLTAEQRQAIALAYFMYAGDYHRAESGSIHPPTWTEPGSLMLIIPSTQSMPLP